MAEIHRCNRCGNLLPSDAPEGTCPACSLRAGLEPGPEAPTSAGPSGEDVTFSFEPVQPGHVLENLARSVGPIPRVLLPDTGADEKGLAITQASSNEMPAPAERGDRYQLFGEIARGGMGAVLKGRDPDLGRDLAVNVLLESHADKPEMLRRFVEEAQIGGQLQHPGVVPVYELGAFADRRLYFTMKLVKGRTLSELLAERQSTTHDQPRFLSIFEATCQTMAYAHARGVIHRDLKPSNVMVGSFGEVQVMDWGLAKVLKGGSVADESPSQPASEESAVATVRSGSNLDGSQAGSIMGTPAYMAPEQAVGDLERVDRRADVFGLGSILCEILTGQPAYTGSGAMDIVHKAMRGETADTLARLDGCGAESDLIALARDCLAPGREDRPRHAGLVAERITAHLSGIQDRLRAAELERARAEARAAEERKRRRLTGALAATLLTLLVVSGAGAAWYARRLQLQAMTETKLLRECEILLEIARGNNRDNPGNWTMAWRAVENTEIAFKNGASAGSRATLIALRRDVESGVLATEADGFLVDRLVQVRSASAEDSDGLATDDAYANAFRSSGIEFDRMTPDESGQRVSLRSDGGARSEHVLHTLCAALDDWAELRRARGRAEPEWSGLVAAARAAAPHDQVDNGIRALLTTEKGARPPELDLYVSVTRNGTIKGRTYPSSRRDQLRALAEKVDGLPLSAGPLLLAKSLAEAGDVPGGVALLRCYSTDHPDDFPSHYELGRMLERLKPPQTDEAIVAYAVARALRPATGHELAHALARRGRDEEAAAVFRGLVGPSHPSFDIRDAACYGVFLKERSRLDEAGTASHALIVAAHRIIRDAPADAAWARQRSQALAYLKAELAGWFRILDSGTPTARGHVRRAMEGWKISERLGYSPFEERLLAQLPEAERGAWRALRNEAESLLDSARNGDH